MHRLVALAALLTCAAPGPAAGAPPPPFWQVEPPESERDYRDAMSEGLRDERMAAHVYRDEFERAVRHYVYTGMRPSQAELRAREVAGRAARSFAARAIAHYERAVGLTSTPATAHHRAGRVLYRYYVALPDELDAKRAQQVLDHWNEFERLAPRDPRVRDMLFDRALVYTKLGGDDNYELAIADYHRLMDTSDPAGHDPSAVATWYSNCAEILMAVGRLDEAVDYYETSLSYTESALYAYGLAVALDRDGREEKARDLMARFARYDMGDDDQPMGRLRDSSVFFVPDGEIHYYYALGYEALGQPDIALDQYRIFARKARGSRYVPRAEQHIRRLEKRNR